MPKATTASLRNVRNNNPETSGKESSVVKPFRRPPTEAEHPAYARYRAMLDRLDGLQKEAD